MIDIEKANQILMQYILDPDFPLKSASLIQQAKEMDLIIDPINWSDGMYFGPVVRQEDQDQAWLIKIGAGRAVVLAFSEIEEGAVVPRLGDNILLTLRHGKNCCTSLRLRSIMSTASTSGMLRSLTRRTPCVRLESKNPITSNVTTKSPTTAAKPVPSCPLTLKFLNIEFPVFVRFLSTRCIFYQ